MMDSEERFVAMATSGNLRDTIFVFGSNLAGRHGKGAALYACSHYGAVRGQGEGLQGRAYALPTKDERIQTLPLWRIEWHVLRFLVWANHHPEITFQVTRVGCGLAGYRDAEIAPMFRDAPTNCILPNGWNEISGRVAEPTRL